MLMLHTGKTEKWTFLRAILLVFSLLLALLFTLFGALELANIAIICGFLLLALVILFWPRVRFILKRLWKKRGGRVVLIVLGVLLAALVVLLTVFGGQVLGSMQQPESGAETVIVLGCQVRNGQPSQLLRHRIDAAADYLKNHPAAMCIVSGGQGWNESISEAECMRRGLAARGIDEARILMEDASTTTQENLAFSKRLMEEHGLSGRVLLVSNNFHLYRALQMAQDVGLEADGLPAACEWYMLPAYVFRESLALAKYRLLG